MKRHYIFELQTPRAKSTISPAQRHTPPRPRKKLQEFIEQASDEKMQNTDFTVEDLFGMINVGTHFTVEKILKFHPELVNQHGKHGTPLMYALRSTRNDKSFSLKLVMSLIYYGANPFQIEFEDQEDSLTPMKFIMQNIDNINNMGILYVRHMKCRELFESCAKDFAVQTHQEKVFDLSQTVDAQAMLEIKDLNESELTQYFANLLDQPELDSVEQEKFSEQKELRQPSVRLEGSLPKRCEPPEEKALQKFVEQASDEMIQNTDFKVKHLFKMLQVGTIATVEKILKFYPELVNQHGHSGSTPLMVVLRRTRHKYISLNLIEKLLDYGADPFLRDIEHKGDDALLTPMEFIMQSIKRLEDMADPADFKKLARFKQCEALFKAYEKKPELLARQENTLDLNQNFDPQAMPMGQDNSESASAQFSENLFAQFELASSTQGQFCNQNVALETDLFTELPYQISGNSKTAQNKNELTASTDFFEALPERASWEQAQLFEKNLALETDFSTTSPYLISNNSKTSQNKNELVASTDFFELTKVKQRLI